MNVNKVIESFSSAPALEELSEHERNRFAGIARRIHRAGFDWYFAESGKVCWGLKELSATRAVRRMGRLTFERGSAAIAIALGKVSRPSFLEQHQVAMEELAGVGPRYVVPLSIAQELFDDEAFIQELREHFNARSVVGYLPDDYKRPLTESARKHGAQPATTPLDEAAPIGTMIQRLAWLRNGHSKFARAVKEQWGGKCAVHGLDLPPGLLIASDIVPWAESDEFEKADPQNGLLLSSPIDALFDRGYISFTSTGNILISDRVDEPLLHAYGLRRDCSINRELIVGKMEEYLRRHRKSHGFPA